MSQNSPNSEQPIRELPPDLRTGGFFDQLLNRTGGSGSETERVLRSHLKNVLCVQQARRSGLMELTRTDDSVLRVAIATKLDEPVENDLWNRALREYRMQKVDYDTVLGEAIPGDLRKEAELYAALSAYESGTNRTALEDFPIFIGRLRLRRRRSTAIPGITTGFAEIDAALGGGLSGVNILGGDSGSGKTSFAMECMAAALRQIRNLPCSW